VGFHKVLTIPPTHALSPVIPPNACGLCITATAGTELVATSFRVDQNFLSLDSGLHPEGIHPTLGVAPSHFRALRKIPYCSPPSESEQCLSFAVAGRPLTPAMRQSLGEPLPHQLADTK